MMQSSEGCDNTLMSSENGVMEIGITIGLFVLSWNMVLEDESEQKSSSTSGTSRVLHSYTAAFNPNEVPIENCFDRLESFFCITDIQLSKGKDNCVPIFCKAHDAPFALRDSVKKELLSHWSSPIVCVPKMNGEIRLCVDLKVILNKYVLVDQYRSPKTEGLLQKFHECNTFCRIDLSMLISSWKSTKVVENLTIKTICGLCVYNSLRFGLSSASAIFKSGIDKILEGIKYCGAYKNDILIGILNHLNDYNVKIVIQESEFFVQSLEMLGYVLSTDGLSPCKYKIEKLINTKSPQNVTQLNNFSVLSQIHQNGS
ncbi:hypothetical protein PR048_018527 [Dryococelus australis]|uniref:Uncharacterized protein n=1 Tax=Dryococelus australis TaxID=614101 RepID=A0ABQ9HCQ7_9NEOP|nr:hypothetical protein PR048_018527 [Dryococelus australis]